MFIYASLDKIADPAGFARIVYQWQTLGPVPSNLVAVTLPWVELVAGLLLIVGNWKREAAAVVAGMLVVFIAAAVWVLVRGIDVDNCGCTSVAAVTDAPAWPPAWMRDVGWYLITRNVVLLAGALVVALVEPRAAAVSEGEGVVEGAV
jgi:uncharacterized membrane protein YphA (DoxX/SURF4 family)